MLKRKIHPHHSLFTGLIQVDFVECRPGGSQGRIETEPVRTGENRDSGPVFRCLRGGSLDLVLGIAKKRPIGSGCDLFHISSVTGFIGTLPESLYLISKEDHSANTTSLAQVYLFG